MLFNSRAVAFLLATLVSFCTTVVLSLFSSISWGIIFSGFLTTFISSFIICFVIFEFLIFKEIRKIYKIFHRFRGDELAENKDVNIPIQKVSQDLYAFANMKEREIEKLKKLETFRREFLADISHELKTPVFSAQGFIHTLLDGAMDDENVRERFLSKAAKSLDDLNTLIQDLISISQMETGEVKMLMEDFDVQILLNEIHEQLMLIAEKRHVTLIIDAKSKEDLMVYADRNRMKQVLKNLIDNAIKYGKEYGTVTTTLTIKKEFIQIAIDDDGPGIPEEHQARIFQRFYRVEKSRSKEMGGTGLGLAIVKHIIEAHDSTISLVSKDGKGTNFTFKLLKGLQNEEN